ncbi:MAG: aminotransferase class I/II-fold pyridoxal phosphate-dependent enzyme [Muribaculaceae bacterium]|nr:aminotransferase class I/II-fold pyridoxal phosphate-dependent enzyme [Muribaculaceae bacterium]
MNTDNKIRPSDRLSDIKPYYFASKLKEIARLNAEGADIISLGMGGPDLPPPEAAVSAAVETLERPDTHSYQPAMGLPALRQAFADWYARWYGVEGLNPDSEVLPLAGSKEGITFISMAFLNKGDGVLVPNPGYPAYSAASRLVQAEIFTYDLREETGWMPDFDQLEKMPLERIKLMWVNYPNMPTGTPASMEVFERLVEFGRRHQIVIINDNPYSFILSERLTSIMQVEGARETCLEMNSLSKCLDMAGWRVGMLIGNAEYLSWVHRVKSNVDSGQSRFVQEGAIAALASPGSWYERLNGVYTRRQKIGVEMMEALGCSVRLPQQGLFVWGRIPDGKPDAIEYSQLIQDEARVFITPGVIFGSNGARYLRISLCSPDDRLEEALKRIKETIR